jgi:hypothetical protein
MSQARGSVYRYEHFALRHMLADLRFDPDSPAPGDRLPHLDLETLAGQRITLGDLDRPHLFVFGSNTCPMTASAGSPLRRLHHEYGDHVRFVLVQVREAHPGEHIGQPASPADKRAHAERLRGSLGIDFAVAVDDLEGSFHASLDPKPNAAYLVGAGGEIVFRSIWASDERGLDRALRAAANGDTAEHGQSTRMVGPMLRAIGHVEQVVRAAGPRSVRDLARSAPPMWLGARIASLFRSLAPERRGVALVAGSAGVVALAAGLGARGRRTNSTSAT